MPVDLKISEEKKDRKKKIKKFWIVVQKILKRTKMLLKDADSVMVRHLEYIA